MKTFMRKHTSYFNYILKSLLEQNIKTDYPHLLLHSRSSFITNFVIETMFNITNETHPKETVFNNIIRYTSYESFIDIDLSLIDLSNIKDLVCLLKELCCHKPLKGRRTIVIKLNPQSKKFYNVLKTFMEKYSCNSWFILISKNALFLNLPMTYVNCNICQFDSFIKEFCIESDLPIYENLITISENDPFNFCILMTLKNPKTFITQIDIYISNEFNKIGRLLSKPLDVCIYLDIIKDLAYSISSSGVPLHVFGNLIVRYAMNHHPNKIVECVHQVAKMELESIKINKKIFPIEHYLNNIALTFFQDNKTI